MQHADSAVKESVVRRPIAPRVADRDRLRASKPIQPPVLIAPEDNFLRGWRRILALPLIDMAWRRGIETNAVACYLIGRRRGGFGEFVMAMMPFLVLIAFFGWLLTHVPQSRSAIWTLVLALAVLIQPLALIMGSLVMGWGLRRYLVGLSVEELLVTRLKPVEILRGLAIRPVCRMSAVALVCSLSIPVLLTMAVLRAQHGFSGEWLVLGFFAMVLTWFGAALASQLGAALALRAHIYIRKTSTAMMRALFDIVALTTRLGVVVLAIGWLCGLLMLGSYLITGRSFGGLFTSGRVIRFGLLEELMFMLIVGIVVLVVGFAILYVFYSIMTSFLRALEDAVEFTYLYPEEWWINSPGRDASEDTYRGGVPWMVPHSEMMEKFRSRACGK